MCICDLFIYNDAQLKYLKKAQTFLYLFWHFLHIFSLDIITDSNVQDFMNPSSVVYNQLPNVSPQPHPYLLMPCLVTLLLIYPNIQIILLMDNSYCDWTWP